MPIGLLKTKDLLWFIHFCGQVLLALIFFKWLNLYIEMKWSDKLKLISKKNSDSNHVIDMF